jgi:phosphoribosylformylglycinamidine synthase
VVVYYYPLEMCFADNNLGAKIDFSVFLKRHHQISICREYRNCISGKRRCCTGKQKRKQCRFHKMGTVTTEATLDLGPSKLDIAKYRDIWFKTSFLLDQNNLKRNGASAF